MTAAQNTVTRQSFKQWLGSSTRTASVTRLFISVGLFLLVWELGATYLINNRLLIVPFSEVVSALVTEALNGALWTNFSTTIAELAIAFPVAVVGGITVGAILAASKPVRQTLDPILTAMYSLPIVALAPLFTAGLGFGIPSKVAIIILMAIFPIITNTDAGLRSADPALIETSRSFSASRGYILRTVTLPHAVPFLVSGVRVAFARALVGVVVAEFFGAIAGFGFAIAAAAQSFQTGRLLGYVVILGVIGLLAAIALTWLERKLAPWKED